ncbi:hypothetical protein HDU85_000410 [Gaertneriomyces sp. JEL0708]|nr:hypothetical protein HDU85_000410 [Gaertneriomyces sp. JEL0708]
MQGQCAKGKGTGRHKHTIVIKLGTSSICDEGTYLPKLSNLSLLVETIVQLRNTGHQVIIVSSGAVGVGLRRLGLDKRPKHLPGVQAVAAVGQGRLMALYDQLFQLFDVPIAQVLLTRDNLADRSQYLNACNTFKELLQMNVVPIVNENDTVSNAEIRFGDNDTLSAITAGMVNADLLFLLTDVECLYTDNPRTNPDARAVRVVDDVAKLRDEGSALGTGGMVTKLIAADLASAAGCRTIITLGSAPRNIHSIIAEIETHQRATPDAAFEPTMGTHFLPRSDAMMDRKWWILHGLATYGTVFVDAGAVRAIIARHRSSLFAAGIVRVEGTFGAQQCVRIATVVKTTQGEQTVEIGKGITNLTSQEMTRVKGHKSGDIEKLLGYVDSGCVVHRDNLVIVSRDVRVEDIVFQPSVKTPT